MSDISRSGTRRGSGPSDARELAGHRMALVRGLCVAALAVAGLALLLSASERDSEAVVQLERLSSRIARAQTLSPETREAIDRLIVHQRSLAGTGDPEKAMRRQAAINRLTNAIQAKDDGATAGKTDRQLPN